MLREVGLEHDVAVCWTIELLSVVFAEPADGAVLVFGNGDPLDRRSGSILEFDYSIEGRSHFHILAVLK